MPYYDFSSDTGEQTTIFFLSANVPSIGQYHTDPEGRIWRRVASHVNTAIDTRYDAHNPKDFVKVTNKPGTFGELWDRSAEFSEKRKDMEGYDPVKEKFDETKRANGIEPNKAEKAREKLRKMGVSVTQKARPVMSKAERAERRRAAKEGKG